MLLISLALAAPLHITPASPPVLIDDQGTLPIYRYPGGEDAAGVELATLPAVVVMMEQGVAPPPGARPLGGPFFLVSTPDPIGVAVTLVQTPGVRTAFPDVVLPKTRRFNDPEYGGQWYLEELGMEQLYAVSLGDPSVKAAVIDSGIDIAHTDLASAVVAPYDAYSDDDDPSPDPGEFCYDGSDDICDSHGTAVAGVMVARADNNLGIAGLCPTCSLVPIKLLGEGAGAMSADVAAFEHAIAQDVAVINNSWGFTEAIEVPDALAEAIHRAATEPRGGLGALVVFAAGNDDRELKSFEMEALDDVVCVSATDSYGNPTNYTNYGDAVDIAAPSATVSIAPGDEVIENFGGTSGAAPVVSGLAAWAFSVAPDMSAAEMHQLLIDTAVPSPLVTADENGHHDIYGYGELNALGVLQALTGGGDSGAADTGEKAGGGCACNSSGASGAWLGLLGLLAWRRRC